MRERERERERDFLVWLYLYALKYMWWWWCYGPTCLLQRQNFLKVFTTKYMIVPISMVHSNKKLLFFTSARQTIRLDLRVTSVELCTTQLTFSLLLLLLLCFCHASIDSMWVQKEREGARERERIKERQKSV